MFLSSQLAIPLPFATFTFQTVFHLTTDFFLCCVFCQVCRAVSAVIRAQHSHSFFQKNKTIVFGGFFVFVFFTSKLHRKSGKKCPIIFMLTLLCNWDQPPFCLRCAKQKNEHKITSDEKCLCIACL